MRQFEARSADWIWLPWPDRIKHPRRVQGPLTVWGQCENEQTEDNDRQNGRFRYIKKKVKYAKIGYKVTMLVHRWKGSQWTDSWSTDRHTCWFEPGTCPSERRTQPSSPWWSTSGWSTLSPPNPNRQRSEQQRFNFKPNFRCRPEREIAKKDPTKFCLRQGHNHRWKTNKLLGVH